MISLICLVDNSARRGSAMWAEHGLAITIQTPHGKVLFDTGQSGVVLEHNAEQSRISLHEINALAFSHAHYDHTGGLGRFLKYCRGGIPLYAHPDLLQERYSIKSSQPRSIGLRLPVTTITQQIDLHLRAEPQQILPGLWTSGEIINRFEAEGRSEHHFIWVDGEWLQDPYRDDQALILECSSGLVVVCGCCHAGLLNTILHIQRLFSKDIHTIIGGLHLQDASQEALSQTISSLRDVFQGRIPQIFANHCSGEEAIIALHQAFPEKVHPCPAGTVLEFD